MLKIEQQKFEEIKQQYEEVLYKKGIPSMFADTNNESFLGRIVGVTEDGKLQVELGDETLKVYDLKEIKLRNVSQN